MAVPDPMYIASIVTLIEVPVGAETFDSVTHTSTVPSPSPTLIIVGTDTETTG